jgi:hypothetical protein
MSAMTTLNRYLLPAPRPLIGAETIQLILLREVLDYTVLRTEDTPSGDCKTRGFSWLETESR